MTAPSITPDPTPLSRALQEAGVATEGRPYPEWLREDLGVDRAPLTALPRTEKHFARALREAERLQVGVVPLGAGRGLGPVDGLRDVGLLLSTEHHTGIVEHSPADHVVTVRTGTRLRDLQAELAPHRQWLALEPPDPDTATIGGLIGAAAPSLLDASDGTLRASLLGCRVLHPDGRTTKAGGKVVKNVSGYDLMKLYHGSRGSLGVILEASFRLRPHPAADVLLELQRENALERSPPCMLRDELPADPTAMHVLGPLGEDGPQTLLLRLQGAEAAVEAQRRRIEEVLEASPTRIPVPPPGPGARPAALARLEQAMARPTEAESTLLHLRALPSAAPAVHAHLQEWAARWDCVGSLLLDGGTGAWWLRFTGDRLPSTAALCTLREELPQRHQAWVQIQTAPARQRADLHHVEMDAVQRSLVRRIKAGFDRAGVLAPGRGEEGR